VLGEASYPVLSHGAELPDAVGRLLASAGLAPGKLKAVAIGTGPGSYTGLRIGLSYAKGLALATGCALAGIPSLDSLALTAALEDRTAAGRVICPVLDARKGEVYAALYRTSGDGLEKLSDDLVVTLANLVPHLGTDVLLVGDAKAAEACALAARAWGGPARHVELGTLRLRGRVVAALGAARVAAGAADNAFVMEPLYVRTAEATFKAGPLTSGAMGNGAEGRSTDPSVRNHR
jgi:tRNA threonylcarbamoyladenosine biosynthesis protein TsaB